MDAPTRRAGLLLPAAAAALCIAVLAFRRPDAFTMPWFYGEEGRDFLAQAFNEGWPSMLGRANGYFHLYPRLVANAGLALGVPVQRMPWVNLAAVLLVYLVVLAYAWMRFPGPRAARCFAMGAVVLVPMGNEVWMNQTNVQWPMSLLIVLILFGAPAAGRRMRALDAALLLIAGFTGPYALVLAPLAAWRMAALARGGARGRALLPAALVLATAALTAASLAGYGTVQRTEGEFSPLDPGFVQAGFFQLWYPLLGKGVHAMPAWTFAPLLAVGLWALALLWRSSEKDSFTRMALAAAALQFLAVLASYRSAPGFLSPYYAGIRNFYLPVVMVAWACLARMDWRKRASLPLAAAVALWWGVQTALFAGSFRFRSEPPAPDLSGLARGEAVTVPIDPPGWTMQLEPR